MLSDDFTAETTEVTVRPFDWKIQDGEFGENLEIRCFALDKKSKPTLIRINDFPNYIYLELPQFIGRKAKKWNIRKAKNLIREIGNIGGLDKEDNQHHKPFHIDFYERKRKVYFYRGNYRVPMVRLHFKMMRSMYIWKRILENPIKLEEGYAKIEMHEAKVSLIQKFLTNINMRYCQWFKSKEAIPVNENDKISTYKHEYFVKAADIEPIDNNETIKWENDPKVCSWDIEAYSDKHLAMPDKYNYKHKAYMISLIFQRLSNKDTRKRYCIVIGDCEIYKDDKQNNIHFIHADSEMHQFEIFCDIIRKENPQLLMGYNIFGFDFPYLDHRIKRINENWPNMSVMKEEKCDLFSNNWGSGAYGSQDINYVTASGRIHLDVMLPVKRLHKMDRYDLTSVGKKFIGKAKLDMPAVEMFIRYEFMEECRLNILKYHYPEASDKQLKKLNRMSVDEFRELVDKLDTSSKLYLDYQEALKKTREVGDYAIRDSELVLDIFIKQNLWAHLMETSSIVCVTPEQLFTKGQQIRCLNIFYFKCARKGYVFDERRGDGKGYSGGFVFEPKPGIHDDVIVLDFKSLYPTIIRAYNICLTTLVPPELYDVVADEDCHVIYVDYTADDDDDEDNGKDDFDEDNKENKNNNVGRTIKEKIKFYKGFEGILPQIERELVDERDAVRKVQKGYEKGTITWAVLEAQQLALKVVANSFYGALGVKDGGKMPLPEGAKSITQKGRELILMVNRRLSEEYGAEVVYNDTDSTMVRVPVDNHAQTVKEGHRLEAIMNGDELKDKDGNIIVEKGESWFLPPIKMEFEKAMRMLCICKKKYAGLTIENDGSYSMEQEYGENEEVIGEHLSVYVRGIALARRDNCQCLRTLYKEILLAILMDKDLSYVIDRLIDHVNNIIAGNLPVSDFTSTRQLGAAYKSESYFMKVFSDRLKRDGKPANAGDRLQFLVCVIDDMTKLLGERMFLVEEYEESNGKLKIDYIYYIERVLMNHINQLISTGYGHIIDKLPTLYYLPKGKRNIITLREPLKLLLAFIEAGKEIDYLKVIVKNKLKELEEGNVNKKTELEVVEEDVKLKKYKPGKNKKIPDKLVEIRQIREQRKLKTKTIDNYFKPKYKKLGNLVIVDSDDEQDEDNNEDENKRSGTTLVIDDDSDEDDEDETKENNLRVSTSKMRIPRLGENNRSNRVDDKKIPSLGGKGRGTRKHKHLLLDENWRERAIIRETDLLEDWQVINPGMGYAYRN